eukprot:11558678-Prorocentrum_lima.AAC.1
MATRLGTRLHLHLVLRLHLSVAVRWDYLGGTGFHCEMATRVGTRLHLLVLHCLYPVSYTHLRAHETR